MPFFTFPVGVAGGMAGALADRGVAGIERARERGGGGVSTELRGVVAGLLSSSRRAGIGLVLLVLLCVGVWGLRARWARCVNASVMLGQPPLVAPRLISLTCAHSGKQVGALSLHLPGQSGQQPAPRWPCRKPVRRAAGVELGGTLLHEKTRTAAS